MGKPKGLEGYIPTVIVPLPTVSISLLIIGISIIREAAFLTTTGRRGKPPSDNCE
jgi:hypothetical protein